MKEEICVNCIIRADNGRCPLRGRPVDDGSSCDECDTGEDGEIFATEENIEDALITETEPKDSPVKHDEQSKEKETDYDTEPVSKQIKTAKSYDYEKLKEMYNGNATFKEMAAELGMKQPSSLTYHVTKLIKNGELTAREKAYKPKIHDEVIPKVKASAPILAEVAPKLAEDLGDDDLAFIRDLMEGADKIVIHRKNMTVTIDVRL